LAADDGHRELARATSLLYLNVPIAGLSLFKFDIDAFDEISGFFPLFSAYILLKF